MATSSRAIHALICFLLMSRIGVAAPAFRRLASVGILLGLFTTAPK